MSLILFGEYMSGERREKNVHLHIVGKETERILGYIMITHGGA